MLIAIDKDENRIYADEYKGEECFCPICENSVRFRKKSVNIKRAHFAHKPDEMCPFGADKDYKSEWHIRMQEYFPIEEREYIFKDKETSEKHIADVYIKEANTVLEFQHSPINKEEFLDRTMFHLKEGRRIVWLFDESQKSTDEDASLKKNDKNDKLVKDNNCLAGEPYNSRSFRWLYRRKCVEEGPPVCQSNYSVCLYTGVEGDVFHRIISMRESSITFSIHDIVMSNMLDAEDFFAPETFWQEQEPWKSLYEEQNKRVEKALSITQARRLRAEAIEGKYHEDYWKAILEYYDGSEGKWKK